MRRWGAWALRRWSVRPAALPTALVAVHLAGCAAAHGTLMPPPVFSSPEAAAIYWVYGPTVGPHERPRPVTLSLASGSQADDKSLRAELSLFFDVQAVLHSDTLYGGEARFRTATGGYYLVVDARLQPSSDSLVVVSSETCRGWPCHSGATILVRRSGTGYFSVGYQGGFIE